MRMRVLILCVFIMIAVTNPLAAQPGIAISTANADLLLLTETILAPDGVTALAWSPDGMMIAYGTNDGTVWLESLDSSADLPPLLEGHTDRVENLAFSPDGSHLLSAGLDGEVRVWDLADGSLSRIYVGSGPIYAVAADPTAEGVFAYAGDSGAILQADWTATSTILPAMNDHEGAVYDLEYSSDGELIASAGADGIVRAWEAGTGASLFAELGTHEGAVFDVSLSPDGENLASAGADGTVWLRPTRSPGEPFKLMDIPGDYAANAVDFGGLGDLVAIGGEDTTVYLYSLPTAANPDPRELALLVGHTDQITEVQFSPLGTMLATASQDATVKLWAVDTEAMIGTTQFEPRVVCEGTPPSRMEVGLRAQVTYTDGRPLRVRQNPGQRILFTIDEGTPFGIVGGPECRNGFTWWELELPDGRRGWSAEGDSNQYYMEPLPPVTSATLNNVAPGAAGTAVIFGTVWHDECDNDGPGLPEGCVATGNGVAGNGIFDAGENGIGAVSVVLGIGACPVDNILDTYVTFGDGRYEFEGLAGGRYCVFIDPASPSNSSTLQAGRWTTPPPLRDDGTAYYTVDLEPDEIASARNFGWDYQRWP